MNQEEIRKFVFNFSDKNGGLMEDLQKGPNMDSVKEEFNKEMDKIVAGEDPTNINETPELKTEITSIAHEQAKGADIKVPKPEELVQKAIASFISSMVQLEKVYSKMSAKQKTRTLMAILDLPTEESAVKLKSNEEKYCFAMGQRIQSDRFIILQDAINKQIQKAQAEQKSKGTVTMLSEAETEAVNRETAGQAEEIKKQDALDDAEEAKSNA